VRRRKIALCWQSRGRARAGPSAKSTELVGWWETILGLQPELDPATSKMDILTLATVNHWVMMIDFFSLPRLCSLDIPRSS
jgi:hypothetical protein